MIIVLAKIALTIFLFWLPSIPFAFWAVGTRWEKLSDRLFLGPIFGMVACVFAVLLVSVWSA